MEPLPTLDAHGHLSPDHPTEALSATGNLLAMTLSLEEVGKVIDRVEPQIAWGVGCYPRSIQAQKNFDPETFRTFVSRTAIVGEIGLDTVSPVSGDEQRSNFRKVLDVVLEMPRFTSIHSYRATALVLEELRLRPIMAPVLHWWTGSAEETSLAVELGCYFSVHSAVARHSKFRTRVPPERILLESDHGYVDPPAAIPCRIEWVEHLVAQQLEFKVEEVRRLVWHNFARIINKTGTLHLLPKSFQDVIARL